MGSFENFKNLVVTYLLANIPKEHEKTYNEKIYFDNISRLSLLTFSFVIINVLTLITNLCINSQERQNFILMSLIVFMTISFDYLSKKSEEAYSPDKFVCKYLDILFPIIFGLGEFLLFIFSGKDIGSFARIVAIPFIMVCIPIINQKKNILITFISYIIITSYLVNNRDNSEVISIWLNLSFVLPFFAVIFSSIIYSTNIINFVSNMNELSAKNKLIELNKKLYDLSKSDQLTSLKNRADFEKNISDIWEGLIERGSELVIMILDIDYYKAYNDCFGRIKGDKTLVEVSKILNEIFSDTQYRLYRYLDEEFVVMGIDSDINEAVELAEKTRILVSDAHIENPRSSTSAYVSISIGISAEKVEEYDDYRKIVEKAYGSLRIAKESGRNKVIYKSYKDNLFKDVKGIPVNQDKGSYVAAIQDNKYVERAIQEIRGDCLFIYHQDSKVIEFSNAAVSIFKLPNSIKNPSLTRVLEFIETSDNEKYNILKHFKTAFINRQVNISFETFLIITGKRTRILISARCIYDENNVPSVVAGTVMSIEEILQYSKFLKDEAMVNSITDLPSRKKFYVDMDEILSKPNSYGYIVLVDIDNFKMINSMYSHNIGDKVLFKVGKLLNCLSREKGKIYNNAVDQFIIILEDASMDDTKKFMEILRDYFKNQLVSIEGLNLKVNFSIGALEYKEIDDNIDNLLVDLDITLQKVKFKGNLDYGFFTEKDKVDYLKQLNLKKELTDAVENNFEGFFLNYQPIISSETKKCIGAEALLRWKDPEGNVIPPISVIPVLELSGLMSKVEEWIFFEVCRQCRKWIDDGAGENFFVQINLSTVQITRPTLLSEVQRAVEKYNLQLKNILLEVTESSIMLEMHNSINTLNELRKIGIKIAVDDFGTGYSSLSYLRSLPIDEIKIDKSFLDNIEHDTMAKDFLTSIVDMSKSMGYIVCVEGVETKEQNDIIGRLKIDYYQGYYYAKPLEPNVFFENFIETPENYKLEVGSDNR